MSELKESYGESSEPYMSKYEREKQRNVTKTLGRPTSHTVEEVIKDRNGAS